MKIIIKQAAKGIFKVDCHLYNRDVSLAIDYDNCKKQIEITEITEWEANDMIKQIQQYINYQKQKNNK